MDLSLIGAMVLGEGHTAATMQIVMPPPGDPRATETPLWSADVKQSADQAFTSYEAAPDKHNLPVAQTLMVIGAGVATLQQLVVDGRGSHLNEEEEESEEADDGQEKKE